ncbi:MAG: hypothetical protein ACXVH2_02770, partial [Methanobacterium sp.]
ILKPRGVIFMAQKKLFEILDEVRSLEDTMTRCLEKGEMDNKLVANWAFDTLDLVERLGKVVEQVEDRLDLLEEETEKKEF